MYGSPMRCCNAIKHNTGVLAINNTNLGQILSSISRRPYSKGSDKDCCKALNQAAGKKMTEWPKSDRADPPPTAWRPECPGYPQPTNYDPYKIKVPDIVVPPLPAKNAKELPIEDTVENPLSMHRTTFGTCQDLFHNSAIVHPDYWKNKPEKKLQELVKETLPKLGYHGRTKYKYAFHEPWRPLDRLALLEEAEKEECPLPDHNTETKQI